MRGCIINRNPEKGNKSDSWRLKVSLGRDPVTGGYNASYTTFRGSSGEAQKRLRELLTEVDQGTYAKPTKYTLASYLDSWLITYCEPNLSPKSTEAYALAIHKHIVPVIGSIPLTSVKPEHIQRLYTKMLTDGCGHRTVKYAHQTLHKALSGALKMGMIGRNPCAGVDTPKVGRHEMKVMSETDLQHFLEVLKDTPYFSLFALDLFTGMRRSELLALRWSDIDTLLNTVSVSRSLHQLKGGKFLFREPKTARSRRLIALPPWASNVLTQERANQEIMKAANNEKVLDSDLIFCHIDGNPLLPVTVSHAWTRIAKKAGLENIRLHDARHTHASLMLKAGVNVKVISERLGHASVLITLDTYSHVLPGMQEAAANSFEKLVSPKVELKALN